MTIRPALPNAAETWRFDHRTQIWPAVADKAGAIALGSAGGPLEIALVEEAGEIWLTLPERTCLGAVRAAVEALSAERRDQPALRLASAPLGLRQELLRQGYLDAGDRLRPEAVWQHPGAWLQAPQPLWPFPALPTSTGPLGHPLRPPTPEGEVYARHIPWLGGRLSFRTATPDQDLDRFHAWMNAPEIARFWEDDGSYDTHREMFAAKHEDPHILPLIGCFEGRPFGWFEVYWARENRIGPMYDVQDWDRGWHVAIGDPECRGRGWITAWLPSLMHFIFLDDPRTQRIVGEPRIDHAQQIRNLDRAGFAKVKAFDFPHKRAQLVMLLREQFFGARLWAPEAA